MKDALSQIVSNDRLTGDYYRLRVRTGWKDYTPGQFLMIDVPGDATFLRRPFGICSLKDGIAEILYKIVGKGTEVMSKLAFGTEISILGPLGKGFVFPNSELRTLNVLVAGGYGIAPLYGLAERLKGETHLFYGAKSSGDLLYLDEFEKLGVKLHLTTEDGSKGERGLITSELEKFSRFTVHDSRFTVFACGPKPMLSAVQSLVASRSSLATSNKQQATVGCQLSLETYMACGSGVCLGCVTKNNKGEYVRVCKEGPVFDIKDLASHCEER